jgi:hypothetical protein
MNSFIEVAMEVFMKVAYSVSSLKREINWMMISSENRLWEDLEIAMDSWSERDDRISRV